MTNRKNIIIAVDGPAGAGKSTVAKKLAEMLNFLYIDTGAMYRAITYKIVKKKIDINNEKELKKLLEETSLLYEDSILYLDGSPVGDEIRSDEINAKVSAVSGIDQVRKSMTDLQRIIGQTTSCILDGRDIGTVVFPQADIKIFLIADVSMRAKRRYKENLSKGMDATLDEIEKSIIERDSLDSGRELAPLIKADDAIEIDTSSLSVDDVVSKILNIYSGRWIQIMIKFPNYHSDVTFRTYKRINTKSMVHLPLIPRKSRRMRLFLKIFKSFNKVMRFSSGIKTKSTNHLKIFRR